MEYLQITRTDWKGITDRERLFNILNKFNVTYTSNKISDTHICDVMNKVKAPNLIAYYMDKKYPKITYRGWDNKYEITI